MTEKTRRDQLETANTIVGRHRRLVRVQEFVALHLAEQLPLSCAASIAGLEQKYFSAYFRRATGMKFSEWLAAIRIKQAMDLLRSSDFPISQVGRMVGYGNPSTFSRAFRRQIGECPSSYRRTAWKARPR